MTRPARGGRARAVDHARAVALWGLRRLVRDPLFCACAVAAIATAPVVLVAAAAWSAIVDRHRWRPLRFAVVALAYVACDAAAVVASLLLWMRLAGRGAMHGEDMQRRHFRVVASLLALMTRVVRSVLGVQAVLAGDADATAAIVRCRRPLIVLSRHSGPGDTFLIVHELLRRGRNARAVVSTALRFDPCIDVLGRRLSFCFAGRTGGRREAATRRIAEVAQSQRRGDALVIFPEGGNYSRSRRTGAIAHLARRGRPEAASRARAMTHVLPPRLGGLRAAVDAAPSADVVFLAHSGLAGMVSPLWRRVPVGTTLRINAWHVRAEEVPRHDRRALEAWLLEWWARVDAWVGATPAGAPAPDGRTDAAPEGSPALMPGASVVPRDGG